MARLTKRKRPFSSAEKAKRFEEQQVLPNHSPTEPEGHGVLSTKDAIITVQQPDSAEMAEDSEFDGWNEEDLDLSPTQEPKKSSAPDPYNMQNKNLTGSERKSPKGMLEDSGWQDELDHAGEGWGMQDDLDLDLETETFTSDEMSQTDTSVTQKLDLIGHPTSSDDQILQLQSSIAELQMKGTDVSSPGPADSSSGNSSRKYSGALGAPLGKDRLHDQPFGGGSEDTEGTWVEICVLHECYAGLFESMLDAKMANLVLRMLDTANIPLLTSEEELLLLQKCRGSSESSYLFVKRSL